MVNRFLPRTGLGVVVCAMAVMVVSASAQNRPNQVKKVYSKEELAKIRLLTRQAASSKSEVALPAIVELEGYGEVARKKVLSIVRTHLYRSARTIQSKSKSILATDKLLAIQERWFELIRSDKLEPKTVSELKKLDGQLRKAFADRSGLLEAFSFRRQLLGILERLSDKPDARFTEDYEKQLVETAVTALGGTFEAALRTHRLLADAKSSDPKKSYEAITALEGIGTSVRYPLVQLVRELIEKDRKVLQSKIASLPSAEETKKLESELAETRTKALANIKVLQYEKDDGGKTMKPAREYHARMKKLLEQLAQTYQTRLQMVGAVARRDGLAKLWDQMGPASEQDLLKPESEKKLKEAALKALGIDVAQAKSLATSTKMPSDPALKPIWFHSFTKQMAQHNKRFAGLMHPEEYANIVAVNQYRAMLGLLPYEIDARLLQSARRHSKEMVALNYFSHTSPTPANSSHAKRMGNAGYRQAGGENIASGYPSGTAAFWGWFSSPGHHRNMAGRYTQIGVGKWNRIYTQNFGRAPRQLGADWSQVTATQQVKGDVLPPQ